MTRAYALRRLAQQFSDSCRRPDDRRRPAHPPANWPRTSGGLYQRRAARRQHTVKPVLTGMGSGTAQIEARSGSDHLAVRQ